MGDEKTFFSRLLNRCCQVQKNYEQKIYSVQRMWKYFQGRAQLFADFASQTSKLISRAPETLWFEEGTVSSAWAKLLKAEKEYVILQEMASKQILELVCNPLSKLVDEMENIKKKSISDAQHQMKMHLDAVSALNKIKDQFHRSSRDAEILELQIKELEGDPKKKREQLKLEKKLNKLRDDIKELECAYRQQIMATNKIQEEYYTKGMPGILTDLYNAFFRRVAHLKDCFVLFSQIIAKADQDIGSLLQQLETESVGIDPAIDLEEFTQKLDDAFSVPPPFGFEPYCKVGSSLLQVKKPPSFTTKATQLDNSNAIFHVPLEDVVARQNANFLRPVKIPLLVKYCCESILFLGGLKAPCIFRISGTVSEIETSKSNLNKGIYPAPSDVHTCAALLKLWLRALPEPIIPANLYTLCLEAQDPLSILGQLPEVNRITIGYLITFVQNFCTPEAEEATSMSRDSIAAIFATCFFRSQDSEELADRLVAAEKEKQFLSTLFFKYVATPDIPRVEPFSYSNWPQIQVPGIETHQQGSTNYVTPPLSPPMQSPPSLPPTPSLNEDIPPFPTETSQATRFPRNSFDTSTTSTSPPASLSDLMGDFGFELDLDVPPFTPISPCTDVSIDDLVGSMFLRKSEVTSVEGLLPPSPPLHQKPPPDIVVPPPHEEISTPPDFSYHPPPLASEIELPQYPPTDDICPPPVQPTAPSVTLRPPPGPPPTSPEIPPQVEAEAELPPPSISIVPPPPPPSLDITPTDIPPPIPCDIEPPFVSEIPPPVSCYIPPPIPRDILPPTAPQHSPIAIPPPPLHQQQEIQQQQLLHPDMPTQNSPPESSGSSKSPTLIPTKPRKHSGAGFGLLPKSQTSTSLGTSGKGFSGFRLPGRSSTSKKT
ncbi:DNA-dependent DNA helicase and ATPase [Pelomyxa schiedti]|nr:DNA-dependent DNA helicase and ATPase [Pelomyxa schiedti]